MEVVGSKQVAIKGLDDKCEMTVLMTINACGEYLPPQLLYAGVTHQCHAKVTFPPDWDVWHSQNHWSNESTMLHFIEHVIVPLLHTDQGAAQPST
jgi:hypothetical protein